MGESLRKASSASLYNKTNLQSVDKLGHRDCLFRVPKDVHSLELAIVSAILEFDTNKVA